MNNRNDSARPLFVNFLKVVRVERAATFEFVGGKWKLKSAGKIVLSK